MTAHTKINKYEITLLRELSKLRDQTTSFETLKGTQTLCIFKYLIQYGKTSKQRGYAIFIPFILMVLFALPELAATNV